jgi:hypothetical protein
VRGSRRRNDFHPFAVAGCCRVFGRVQKFLLADRDFAAWSSRPVRKGGDERVVAALIVLVLLLLLLGGGGLLSTGLHILWILLVIGLILWVLGFVFRSAGGGRRWYNW